MASSSTASEIAALIGGHVIGERDPEIVDVTHDSRQAGEGVLFAAIRGANHDGHEFVADAVSRGCDAVMVQQRVAEDVIQIVSQDTRGDLGPVAAAVHGNPSEALDVVGVTGTNGKTTVTHYVESIGRSCGLETGLVGTIALRIGSEVLPARHTTPEASDMQRLLARMRDSGVRLVAAEVSSHALALGRAKGTRFEVAAFTNISQDHLDFHATMTAYADAKKALFRDYEVGTAVVNIDDAVGAEIAREFSGPLVTIGRSADVAFGEITQSGGGSRFDFFSPWGESRIEARVRGGFNVENLVTAAATCLAMGLDFNEVVVAMASVDDVPGRFEMVSGEDPVSVIVDYAHTPDGVSNAIGAASSLGHGRVIALVGAGGDRDRDKRPKMGAALSVADVAIVTSDNPRSEDPEQIADAVASGVEGPVDVIIDRREAIEAAIEMASEGDVVLILGRGHEPLQEFAAENLPFDDREVATRALARVRKSAKDDTESGSMDS